MKELEMIDGTQSFKDYFDKASCNICANKGRHCFQCCIECAGSPYLCYRRKDDKSLEIKKEKVNG